MRIRDIAEAQGTPCSTDTASAQCIAALQAIYLELLSCQQPYREQKVIVVLSVSGMLKREAMAICYRALLR